MEKGNRHKGTLSGLRQGMRKIGKEQETLTFLQHFYLNKATIFTGFTKTRLDC